VGTFVSRSPQVLHWFYIVQANWDADEADKMPDDVVLANMGSIVHGGQETTSSSLARFLTIVAEDSDLQQKLRAELQDAKAVTNISDPISSHF
jgi:cytochrome P450